MSFWGPRVRRYRWDGFGHGTLYDFVNSGRGAAAVDEADQAWTEFTTLLVESKATVDKALRDAGAEWQGQAAELASAGVSPLTDWAENAADAGAASKASLQDVAQAFAHTAHAMPEPVVVPSRAAQGIPGAFAEIIDGQHDEDAVARHAQQAHLHAIELMTAYNLSNIDSAGTTGTFDDPPEIGVTTENGSPFTGSRSDVIVTSFLDDGERDSADPEPGEPAAAEPDPGSSEPQPATEPVDPARRPGSLFDTGPADLTGAPTLPAAAPVVSGTSPASGNPVPPVTGALTGTDNPYGSSGRAERRPDESGRPGVDRGGRSSVGPFAAGEHPTRGGTAAGRGTTTAFGPVAGTRRDEDEERTSPEYLRDFNDEYWEGTPPRVSPPVIGKDDD